SRAVSGRPNFSGVPFILFSCAVELLRHLVVTFDDKSVPLPSSGNVILGARTSALICSSSCAMLAAGPDVNSNHFTTIILRSCVSTFRWHRARAPVFGQLPSF